MNGGTGGLTQSILAEAVRQEGLAYPLISMQASRGIAERTGVSLREVESAALEAGVVPIRYQRNIGTIGIEGQLRLTVSRVGICGLGGLGGYVAEELARFGVGYLALVDGEVFEESNINRQLLCTEGELGQSKAEVAARRVRSINRATEVTVMRRRITAPEEAVDFFSRCEVVVDALDNVPTRLLLEECCARLGVPLVHGAIAGNSGQVMTIYPGDPGLKALYPPGEDHGVEELTGNPPTTPALVATLQTQEVVKVLCGGETIRNGFLLLDTATNVFEFIPLR